MQKKKRLFALVVFSILLVSAFQFAFALEDELPVTCDAYFEGYKFNGQECELESMSGCENPFEFSTKEECESAHKGESDFPVESRTNFNEKYKEEFKGEEIELADGGTTPDSALYFLDNFFDRFGDDIEVKEEKVAEIKAMIEKGDIESARIALKNYKQYAEKLGKEIDPEKQREAKKSSLAIEKALNGIEEKLSEDEKQEFLEDVLDDEEKIITTAEISGKIKELCQALSELDPTEYSRICRTEDDSPDWQKKLDKKWTEDQKQEARKFAKIMSQCFKTSGKDCKCEEIPFDDFADACSEAAPLATACDLEGDERACEKLDSLKMPELPPHLQEVFESLESGIMEDKFEMHMPRECVEAGVEDPKECGRIMIETNAPEECKEALLKADVQSEREGREICDKIMMNIHAPDCAEKGITDPDECARFMDSFRGDGPKNRGGGPMIDFDCKGIEDSAKRLECYDKASSQAKGFGGISDENYDGPCMSDSDWKAKKAECRSLYGDSAGDEPIMGDSGDGYKCPIDAKCIDFSQGKMDFEEIKQRERECANRCESENKAWDFSYGDCKCFGGDERNGGDDYSRGPGCGDCSSQCPAGANTNCVNDRCVCGEVQDSGPRYAEGEGPGELGDYDNNGEPPSTSSGGGSSEPTDSGSGDGSTTTSGGVESSSGGSGSSDGGSSEPSSSSGGGGGGDSGGEAPITGNAFLDYYY
ncbi:MAG: hypothetical protein ABH840_01055 [Nanoarchaeota archaeon]